MKTINRVLVLAPHTDDGELGCGGTMSKLLKAGVDVFIAVFSICDDSLPEGFEDGTLKTEFINSMETFNMKEEHIQIFNYPVRHFGEYRQDILQNMVEMNNSIKPDLVFIPAPHDIHQDHSTIASEAMRAFKRTSLLGYELPWNNYTFNNQSFSILDEENILDKILGLQCYETQKNRIYFRNDVIKSIARTHGVQVGGEYAEVFETIRWIL